MERRREELVRILNRRRRRVRLLLVCTVTAMGCGLVAGVLGPQVLIGGVPDGAHDGRETAAVADSTRPDAGLLELSSRLRLDPREQQANAIQWNAMSEAERRNALAQYWRLAEMDPADQEKVFQRYEALRNLPEKRIEFLRSRAARLRDFIKTLSPQDQAVLESMSDQDRAARLLQLWKARYGAW